ncbi:MAG TPA: hypothetical protein VLS52_10305 [Rudaea sp.]|nr:hypothetical protein [Rudaea sp.]
MIEPPKAGSPIGILPHPRGAGAMRFNASHEPASLDLQEPEEVMAYETA